MSEQHTNVTYNAVSNFADLHGDLDGLLLKIKALKKAEKDLNQQRSRTANTGASKSADPARAAKLQEATDARRIKRLDAAQRLLAAKETRHERSLSQAQQRRNRLANQAQKVQQQQENRHQQSLDQAQARRSRRASQDLKNAVAAENRQERRKDAAQKRRIKAEDEAQAERLRREKQEADLVRAAEKASLAEDIRTEAQAQKLAHLEEERATRRNESIKDVAQRERNRQLTIIAREQEAKDKKAAQELLGKIAAARSLLGATNGEARDGNKFTRRPVQERSVGQVKVNYNADKDANYYQAVTRAREEELRMIERSTQAVNREMESRGALYNILRKIPSAAREAGASTSGSFRNTQRDVRRTNGLLENFRRNLDQIGRWRPRLIPPFIALVPIIASLLALINPLVAGLGAIGGAAIGLAGSIASLAGAALGAIPALASLLSVGSALKMVFGGVGKALKAAGKANGGGAPTAPGGGPVPGSPKAPKLADQIQLEELTQVEKIQRAQENYRRSIEDVADAQLRLTEAKDEYFDRLKDIESQIKKNALEERRAAANVQLAEEAYWNTMADSGSTKGQKMDAAVSLEEAKQEAKGTTQEIQELRKELDAMKAGGVNADPAVKSAMRGVTDAVYAQRDAQIDLANAYKGTEIAAAEQADAANAAAYEAAEAAGGVDEFAEAMAKLSPSAQAVVLALLAMQPAWEAVRKSVQERFFSEIVEDIQLLVRLFPVLENLLGNAAGALGRVASRGLRLVTSDKWLRDLNILAEQNVPLIENVGDGLLEILDMMLDLAVAAGPFYTALTEGFREGAKNLGDLVANARETGSLANWLEVVRGRLAQWWRIIKNIGATLFNYSAAAAPFGQWMTDGMENMTAAWRKASEEARKEGSPFQTWLEDIKPALSELRDLFATFFKWFGREASNPDNIKQFTQIIDTITEELGPALARIFDALSETGVGESLLDALVQIFEAIATFLEKGGADGIKQFFDTVNDLFGTFAGIIERTDPEVVKGIASALATISALRFFGITKLIGGLITLMGSGKLGKLVDLFKNMKETGKVPAKNLPIGAGGTVPTPGVAAGAGSGAVAGNATKGSGILGAAGKTGGVLAGLAALLGMTNDGAPIVGNLFSGAYKDDPKSGSKDTLNWQTKWGMPGVGLGIDIISMFFPEAGKNIEDWLAGINETIVDWVYDLPGNIAETSVDIWNELKTFPAWLAEQWDTAVEWVENLPTLLGETAGSLWAGVQTFNEWLAEKWIEAGIWLAGLPGRIGEQIGVIAGGLWSGLQTFNQWLAEKWIEAGIWLAGLPGRIGKQAKKIWAEVQTFPQWLNTQIVETVLWFSTLPIRIALWGKGIWDSLPSIGTWLAKQTVEIAKWFAELPTKALKPQIDFFTQFGEGFESGYDKKRGGPGGGGRGLSGMSRGGDLPPIKTSGGSGSSLWATLFGDPIAWLEEKWAEIPAWFSEKTAAIIAPITNAATVITMVWSILWAGFSDTLKTAYESVVVPITQGIGTAFGLMATGLTLIYALVIKPALDNVGKAFRTLKVSYVDPMMQGISRTISNIVTFGIIPVLAVLSAYVRSKPVEAFRAARDGIAAAWSGIKELAKSPVRFVVNVVLGGLVDALNKIKGVNVAKPRLPEGFHDGGYTGNKPARQAVGVVHGDEHVIRAQSRQKIERSNPGLLDHMNTFGEVPGYKKGGLVNPLPAGSYSVSQPYRGAAHNGIDLAAASGTKVYATGEGTVQMAQSVNMGGNEVYIQHDNGLGTRYSHLSGFASRPGDKVKPGNIIGYVGSTGMSTGPHLHYMVHNPGGGPGNYNNHQDPAGWMNGNAQELGEAWNPLQGMADFVSNKISERFPGGGMWVDAAAGIMKQGASQAISHYTKKIGTDDEKAPNKRTLFDKGGWWNGKDRPESKLSQPEAILTTPQFESMHNLSNLATRAFGNLSGSAPIGSTFGGSPASVLGSSVSSNKVIDKSINIEKVEINNPVGETSNDSIANTIRDMKHLGG